MYTCLLVVTDRVVVCPPYEMYTHINKNNWPILNNYILKNVNIYFHFNVN